MELCDINHEAIAYNSTVCPLCEAHEKIYALQIEVEKLKRDVASYEEADAGSDV